MGGILLTKTAMIVDAEILGSGSSFSGASTCAAAESFFISVVIVGGMVIRSILYADTPGMELAGGMDIIDGLYIQAW
jgi:hypothetical protein